MKLALKGSVTLSASSIVQGIAEVALAVGVLVCEELVSHISVWDGLGS